MTRPFLIHLLYMILGYALAVLVATTVVVVVMGLPTVLPDQGAQGSFYRYLKDFPMMFLFGLMITSLYALPGWLVTVIFAEWRSKRGRLFFAVTGFFTALLALILAGMGRGIFAEPLLHGASLVGGLCGGLAYWALAGKKSGGWKQTP
ncbi:MAG: hypothetical protein WCC66_04830 [Rhizobiaceae bacterium]